MERRTQGGVAGEERSKGIEESKQSPMGTIKRLEGNDDIP